MTDAPVPLPPRERVHAIDALRVIALLLLSPVIVTLTREYFARESAAAVALTVSAAVCACRN